MAANYTYNAANQLVSDGTNTLTYDNNGNMTSDGVNSYTWDRANRLLTSDNGVAADLVNHAYDGEDRRVSQAIGTTSPTITKYLLDIQPGLAVVLSETTGANTMRYVHSPRGIHAHKDTGGNWEWMVQDGLGSVREVVDNSVGVLESRNYDPYGNPFGATGTGQTEYGFTGELVDGSGLLDLRARRYNAGIGTFASLDPIETQNRYAYVNGNPVNRTDPRGLMPCLQADGELDLECYAANFPVEYEKFKAWTEANVRIEYYNDWVTSSTDALKDKVQVVEETGGVFLTILASAGVPMVLGAALGFTVAGAIVYGIMYPPAPPPEYANPDQLRPATPPPPSNATATPAPGTATSQAPQFLPERVPVPPKTCTDTSNSQNSKQIVLDSGAGLNITEIENILLARPNQKVVVVEHISIVPALQLTIGTRYPSDRLEIIGGTISSSSILGGRQAIEMFSIYPDVSGEATIKSGVSNHLEPGGRFYTVTELPQRLQNIANNLSSMMAFGYVRINGVPTADIMAGKNGPNIPFNSPVYQSGRAYDLWGIKK